MNNAKTTKVKALLKQASTTNRNVYCRVIGKSPEHAIQICDTRTKRGACEVKLAKCGVWGRADGLTFWIA